MGKIKVTICMGSSCFSRGNNIIAETLERYLKSNNLENRVEMSGCLCENKCKEGPNIKINGELYSNVSPEAMIDLLNLKLTEET